MRRIIIDLDGTLTVDDKRKSYPEKPLDGPIAEALAAARAQGLSISIMTARGMRTWKNDRALVEQHVRPQVEAWLAANEVPHDELVVAKPWCGPRGFYVDDRNLHLEEFRFRFTGPFAGLGVTVVGAASDHARLSRIERWLDVRAYRYADPLPDLVAQDDLVNAQEEAPWELFAAPGANPAAFFSEYHEVLTQRPLADPERFALFPSTWDTPRNLPALTAAIRSAGGFIR